MLICLHQKQELIKKSRRDAKQTVVKLSPDIYPQDKPDNNTGKGKHSKYLPSHSLN